MNLTPKGAAGNLNENGGTKESDLSNVDTQVENKNTYNKELELELNSPYIDVSSITISPQGRQSLYRLQNQRVLEEPRYVIGGSCESARVLVSNSGEVDKYFPRLVGCMPNHTEFLNKVKEWLDNIAIVVPSIGYTLDTSFRYYKKSDYLQVAKEMAAINLAYNEADKNTASNLIKALKTKEAAINNVESRKWMIGEPLNVNNYVIYRHCLLYSDIAKDMRLFQFKPNVRFYFKDERQEEEIAQKRQLVIEKAMANYLAVCSDKEKFDAVYTIYCHRSGFDLSIYLNKKELDKKQLIKTYSETSPYKFNKLVEDRHLAIKAMVEKLIALGDLLRDENNNRIGTRDGKFIAANLEGAVTYFTDPANKVIREMYETKLKATL